MKIFNVLTLVVATVLSVSFPASADVNMTIADAHVAQQLRFAGLDVRVDKIESVSKGDKRPASVKTSIADETTGYIMVTVSMQNPSAAEPRSVPGILLGFELADGSQIDETGAAGEYIVPNFVDTPRQLHPKQRIDLMYVVSAWSGSAPTKMFFKLNGADDSNQSGLGYLRFQLAPGAVTNLAPQS